MSSLDVNKTYKLFIGGAFPRSESGRTYEAKDKNKNFVANVALASRKDGRDAVVAARSAFAKWSEATAYNRAQVLYRVSEIMQGRREQFVEELCCKTSSARAKLTKIIKPKKNLIKKNQILWGKNFKFIICK